VILLVDAHEPPGLDVCVDFRCVDCRMAQQELHSAQVGATFQKVRGKGVPEGVRRNAAANACFLGVAFDAFPHALAREPLAGAIDEKCVASGA